MDNPSNSFESLHWKSFVLAVLSQRKTAHDIHVSPDFDAKSVWAAFGSFLNLAEGEAVLALCDNPDAQNPLPAIVLTSHRICVAAPGSATPDDVSISYADLPEQVSVRGLITPQLAFDERVLPTPPGLSRATLGWIADALTQIGEGARSERPTASVSELALANAQRTLATFIPLVEPIAAPRTRSPHEAILAASSTATGQPIGRVFVTPLIIAACVLLYLIMVVRGVSPFDPTAQELYQWGGGLGQVLALDHEFWRLFTPLFLHGGLPHLLFNMICLWQVGRLVERLYGNVGFTLIYLISGLFASVASSWWHPQVVSVGASGALFGTIGALVVFLMIHRHVIPLATLRTVRTGTIAFLVYNLIPGFFVKELDSAAHLGGLLGGMFTGLCLGRAWPIRSPHQGVLRQLAMTIVPVSGLCLATYFAVQDIPNRMPDLMAQRATEAKIKAIYDFLTKVAPWLNRYNETMRSFGKLTDRLSNESSPTRADARDLDAIAKAADEIETGIKQVAVTDPEIAPMREALIEGAHEFVLMTDRLAAWFKTPNDRASLEGPDGMAVHFDRKERDVERFQSIQEALLQKYEPKTRGSTKPNPPR